MPEDASTTGPGEEMLRLFVAIPLSETVRRGLEDLSRRLRTGLQFTSCHPAWVAVETMHLTLAFLGKTPAAQVEPIAEALRRVGAAFGSLTLEIRGVGVFPHWRRPRVLWIGARDRTKQIGELHGAIERELAAFDYEPEEREFRPHLTLARFKALKGTREAESIVIGHRDFDAGTCDAGEMILFKSELHPDGARHTALHCIRLGGAR